MTRYFLGIDVGGTKSHALIADDTGRAVGFGEAGPGNHEVVGYDGLRSVLQRITSCALDMAGIDRHQIAGAGFGVAGYDWPSELAPTLEAISGLGLNCPIKVVNDTVIGLVAGAKEGWGVALVAGTSNNCWGWDEHHHIGRVIGGGMRFGENAGAYELVAQAIIAIAKEWTRRGPATALTPAFMAYFDVKDAASLLEGIQVGRLHPGPALAPLIFQIAEAGDAVAQSLIRWAGEELADLAKGVIRQLGFQDRVFDLVLAGSMFNGGPLLMDPMKQSILEEAPGARFVRLTVPPVVGAVLLGMQQGQLSIAQYRSNLVTTSRAFLHERQSVNDSMA
ncbi:MAG TPA: ATPase [Anaerolineae bacterium]|nr:ATPase [Caldilineae bacterium]HID35263.1 ATPase [Anaerolineae bacterium]